MKSYQALPKTTAAYVMPSPSRAAPALPRLRAVGTRTITRGSASHLPPARAPILRSRPAPALERQAQLLPDGPPHDQLRPRCHRHLLDIYLDGEAFTEQPLDGEHFNHVVAVLHHEDAFRRVNPQTDILPLPGLLDVVAEPIHRHGAVAPHLADVALPVEHRQPAVRIDHGREGGAWGERRVGDTRRLVATTQRLVRALEVVMLAKPVRDGPHRLDLGRTVHRQALVGIRSIVAFHKGVLIWPPGGTARDLDPQAMQQAHQRRGEIAALRAAHEARIAIQGDRLWEALRAEGVDDRLEGRLGREILADLGVDEDRGADIHGIEHLDHALLFALTLRPHGRDVLEIELPGAHRLRALDGLMPPLTGTGDAAMLAQDLPDGAGRARQAQALRLEGWILAQVIEDGLGPGSAVEVGRRVVPDLEEAVNDHRAECGRRMLPRPRLGMEHVIVLGQRADAFDPLLDPTERVLGGVGEILLGPGGLRAQQGPQERAIGEVLGFGVHRAASFLAGSVVRQG